MSNILNNNFHNLKLKVNNDEYWDFFVNNDCFTSYDFNNTKMFENCLISYIDVSLYDCVFDDEINSLPNYYWDLSNVKNYTLNNIGYTGFDNGLLYFRKDKIMNKDFIELYRDSKYEVKKNNYLILHQVTGSTMVYEYPICVEENDVKLNGGFYQGFFKTECDKYQVLPSVFEQGDVWEYEFVLKKCDFEKESNKTLNDKYPENKGIFFYIGTRAENKWIYLYDKDGNDECFTLSPDDYVEDSKIDVMTHKINSFLDMSIEMPTPWDEIALDDYVSNKYFLNDTYNHTNFSSGYLDFKPSNETYVDDLYEIIEDCYDSSKKIDNCSDFNSDYVDDTNECDFDYVEDDIDISDFIYTTDDGFVIGKYEEYIETDNKFLLFNRTCDGFNVNNWENGSVIRYVTEKYDFKDNLFLLMNRTNSGYTVNNISLIKKSKIRDYDIYKDLYNNALAFRITDNGAIGYRYLIQNCDDIDSPYKILEGYSKDGIINNNEWCVVHVKINAYHDTMQMRFYVNGNLVFVTSQIPKLNLRELNEVYDKQETVPFNISIGGGTQGLCDVILPNYMIEPYRVYPLEKHFAGTFIGYFKSFKMYNCDMEYLNILNNFNNEMDKLNLK